MTDQLIAGVDELRRRFESRYGQDGDPGDLATQMHEARQLHDDALEALHRQAGDRALTASEQRKWDAHSREARALEEAAAEIDHAERKAKEARIAERRAKWGYSIRGESIGYGRGAWAGLDQRTESPTGWIARAHSAIETSGEGLADRAKEMLARSLSEPGGDIAARLIVARSNPSYSTAFNKVLANPERALLGLTPEESHAFSLVESTRGLTTSAGSAGYLLPLVADPSVAAIVNAGATSPFRQLAAVKSVPGSPYRAVTSPGITAEWTSEGAVWADASPTFGHVDIPLFKMNAFVGASFEIFADAGEVLAAELPKLLADARDVAEASAFATGNGTTAPQGVVTALVATTGSTVTATTRGSFSSASSTDMFNLLNALPARARKSPKLVMLANPATVNTVRQMVVGTAGVPLIDMAATVPTPLGTPLHESSAMTASTTSGSYLVVAADLGKYLIVDHLASPTLEFAPVMYDQATGRPNGTRGWLFHHRVGAAMLDGTQGRVLMT